MTARIVHQTLTGLGTVAVYLATWAGWWPGWVGSFLVLAVIVGGVAIKRSMCGRRP